MGRPSEGELSAELTRRIEEALRSLGGRRSGDQWSLRCPFPDHADENPSFSCNSGRGVWLCHGCGKRGGPTELLEVLGLASFARGNGRPQTSKRLASPKTVWKPIFTVPNDGPPRPETHPELGRPAEVHEYRDSGGRVLGYVYRFDLSNGEKAIRPLTLWSRKGSYSWRWRSWPFPKPLYGQDHLAAGHLRDVLVVEGEKAADAARNLFPDLCVVTSPGGARAASKADWSSLEGRDVVIWPDADEDGVAYAESVAALAQKAGATAARIVRELSRFPTKWDLADPLPTGVREADLRDLLVSATPYVAADLGSVDSGFEGASWESTEDLDALLRQAGLPESKGDADPAAIERFLRHLGEISKGKDSVKRAVLRDHVAKLLKGLGVQAPAKLIDAAMSEPAGEPESPSIVEDLPEPWPEPVDGSELLDSLARVFSTYVVLPEGGAETLSLWTVFTYVVDAAEVSPMLAITSPEKRCGKTTLLTLIGAVVARPLSASNLSPAAVYRAVDRFNPTLIVDEVDTFIHDSNDLRGILNSGHVRANAYAIRVQGENHDLHCFYTFGAKCVACIGTLPDTLADRSVGIELRRRLTSERGKRLRLDSIRAELSDIRRQLTRFALDHIESLKGADPEVPDSLHDREADNWRPMFAIADEAGGEWANRARRAALVRKTAADSNDGSGIQLLRDLKDMFDLRGTDRAATQEILDHLCSLEESPWGEYARGKPLTPRGLAKLLKRFGARSKQLGGVGQNLRGYDRSDLDDAFARYLADDPLDPLGPLSSPRQSADDSTE